jgi:hypothetical protein
LLLTCPQEEEDDFYPCHARFGLLGYYATPRLEGKGEIMLPNNLLD